MMTFKQLLQVTAVVMYISSHATADVKNVDENLPSYNKVDGVTGSLSSVGSDSLANLMALWAETFRRYYPNVTVKTQSAGSSTAPVGLTEGGANIGLMSRKMTKSEVAAFKDEHGYKPTGVLVAIDALTIYVHKDNPLKGLSVPQVDAIFSLNRQCHYDNDIIVWGDTGLTGSWAESEIVLYGRNYLSGTYGYFKDVALCKGSFKEAVRERPGSASIVRAVANSLNAVGYSSIGYRRPSVRALPLSRKHGGEMVEATAAMAIAGEYPLSRYMYVYVDKHPGEGLGLLESEFIKFALSKVGQQIVLKDGYIPLPNNVARRTLAKSGVSKRSRGR